MFRTVTGRASRFDFHIHPIMPLISPSQVAASVDAYLEHSIGADAAAKALTEAVEQNLADTAEEDEDTPTEIYDDILRRIRKTRHDSPIQDQLVQLLAAIKTSTSLKRGNEYWSSLEPFGLNVRELWNGELEDNSVEGWTSLNAFVARVDQLQLSSFDDYAIWAMRSSVEAAAPEDSELDTTDSYVPPATTWILYGGEKVWERSQAGLEGTPSTRGGPLWTGKRGYSVERWLFWKKRFCEVAAMDDLKSGTREMASKANEIMDKISNK